ncbi:MAG TPA: hypothetical protein VFF26_10905 [Gallionella sp.]|nr:hypothetical protein [Gallionella sp.]
MRWSTRRAASPGLIRRCKTWRKDFIGMAALSAAEVTSKKLRPLVVKRFRQAAPYMGFLCKALELRF